MPTYAMIGDDGPRGAELRREHRAEHLRHLEPLAASGRIRFAGPLLDADAQPVGSLVVFDAADPDEAERIAASDPYVRHGIFTSYRVCATRQVFPTPEG